jgi:hypothetical protein
MKTYSLLCFIAGAFSLIACHEMKIANEDFEALNKCNFITAVQHREPSFVVVEYPGLGLCSGTPIEKKRVVAVN